MTPECILATCLKSDGYGRVTVKGKRVLAHRLAYAQHWGISLDSLEGISILHTCDTPACINPKHLFAGTQADNMRDRQEKGRQPKGSAHGRAMLTEEDILEIRLRTSHGEYQREVAKLFGVSKTTVSEIVSRKHWGHI